MSAAITGFPSVSNSGQGGLLDVCIYPQFSSNRMVYWTYVRNVTGGTTIAVAKGRLSNNESLIENPVVIYASTTPASPPSNYGSSVMFDSTGNLLVRFGDRFIDNVRIEAQSASSSVGKVIRIDTNGNAASGNPVISQLGARPMSLS